VNNRGGGRGNKQQGVVSQLMPASVTNSVVNVNININSSSA
jgi:hypothetical protein